MIESERKISLVTGASRGIGRAVAVALAGFGHYVLLTARSDEELSETLRQVKAAGGDGQIFTADLSQPSSVASLASEILAHVDAIDVIVNVAGLWHDDTRAFQGPHLEDTPIDETRAVMEVGLLAPMVLVARLLPLMIERHRGHIINISGTFSDGATGWLHYFVAKKGIEQFTIGLADELRDHEIQVNCVSPADVATEPYLKFYPEYAASALKPDQVAEVVVNLLAPVCENITGQVIEVRNRSSHG